MIIFVNLSFPHLYLQKDFMLDPIRRCAFIHLRIRDILQNYKILVQIRSEGEREYILICLFLFIEVKNRQDPFSIGQCFVKFPYRYHVGKP